jgi:hypothetical protein
MDAAATNNSRAAASDDQPSAAQPAFEGGSDQATVEDLPTGEPNEARKMPQSAALKALGINTFGWIEQGATFNSLNPTDRWNGPVGTNDRSDDYQLNQMWVGMERAVHNVENGGFDIGGRIDAMYGSDWRYGASNGFETRFDAPNQEYGFIVPQFYALAGYNNLTVKMGHYAECMGYEVVAAPGNFFYSHSYALMYSEPVLVTGVEADYKLSDNWNLIGGFNRGWQQNFDDNNSDLDFVAGIKWHNDETKTGLSFILTGGQYDNAGQDYRFDYALVFKQQLTEKLLYVAQHNLGGEQAADPYTGGYAMWYGLDQYLIYTINERWSVGSRVEWFRDQNGAAVAGIGNFNTGWMGKNGFCGSFTEATFGANWKPNKNVVLRPELRWDSYSGSTNVDGQLPFGDGTRSSQFLFATDLIVTF